MENNPLVSIVALCYNHERFLRETLDSIINQTYKKYELIIIDDCSRDNSVQEIENWVAERGIDCRTIFHKQNIGICKSLNEGIKVAGGKYFTAIACDDVMLKEKVAMQVATLEQHTECDLAYSDCIYISDDGDVLRESHFNESRPKIFESDIYNELLKQNFIPANTVFFRTEVLKKMGGYDESMLFEDYDMWLTLAKQRKKFAFIDKPLTYYRIHTSNMHRDDKFYKRMFPMYIKHNENGDFSNQIKKIVKKGFVNKERLSLGKSKNGKGLMRFAKDYPLYFVLLLLLISPFSGFKK